MKHYKVLKYFEDIEDTRHQYQKGDVYPREGVVPSEKRIASLLNGSNRRNEPLIEVVEVQTDTNNGNQDDSNQGADDNKKDVKTSKDKKSKASSDDGSNE